MPKTRQLPLPEANSDCSSGIEEGSPSSSACGGSCGTSPEFPCALRERTVNHIPFVVNVGFLFSGPEVTSDLMSLVAPSAFPLIPAHQSAMLRSSSFSGRSGRPPMKIGIPTRDGASIASHKGQVRHWFVHDLADARAGVPLPAPVRDVSGLNNLSVRNVSGGPFEPPAVVISLAFRLRGCRRSPRGTWRRASPASRRSARAGRRRSAGSPAPPRRSGRRPAPGCATASRCGRSRTSPATG